MLMSKRFADNPDYCLYETLLIQVHKLIASGDGDSDAADALREQMDDPWYRLSEDEQARLRGLSGDLYLLVNSEKTEPEFPPGITSREWAEHLQEARDWSDWTTVLSMVRRRPALLPPEEAALLRAQAYDALGHPNPALLFLDFAHRVNKKDAAYRAVRMLMLSNAARWNEAVSDADRIVKGGEPELALLVAAADVFLLHAGTLDDVAKDEAYRRVLDAVRPAIEKKSVAGATPMSLIASAHLIRATAFWELGERTEALAAVDAAVDSDPGDRVLKGIRELLHRENAVNVGSISIAHALDHRRELLRREFHGKRKAAHRGSRWT